MDSRPTFYSDVAQTQGALPAPSLRHTDSCPIGVSADCVQLTPKRAAKSLRNIKLFSQGCEVGFHLEVLSSQLAAYIGQLQEEIHNTRRYETRRPPTTQGATTSSPENLVRCLPAKRVRTSGPNARCSIAPPIEGNSDYRSISFHLELYFDQEAIRQQPELRDSYGLLQEVPS
ncbi:hypothetical protein CK203_098874 [Vitis vinifera]|uniref:Uncharacterized protein n=1 Tax=Vitis vinifera TaxID=29760 RepID=A0A438DDH0_VITVI|nr:hypothetical protein CK203_098874 [Vitis vinifera]